MNQDRPKLDIRSTCPQLSDMSSLARLPKPLPLLAFCTSLLFLVLFGPLSTSAAERRPWGYVPMSEAEFASLPKAKPYRGLLPKSVDLSSHFPIPGDQGKLNACTSWATAYARSYYAQSIEGRKRNSKKDIPSQSFIYNSTRDPKDCESGSNFFEALELLKRGSLSLADYPYNSSCELPDQEQKAAATDFKIDSWGFVDWKVIDNIKGAVARGQPVMFGMNVEDDFQDLRGAKIYYGGERRDGRHAHDRGWLR